MIEKVKLMGISMLHNNSLYLQPTLFTKFASLINFRALCFTLIILVSFLLGGCQSNVKTSTTLDPSVLAKTSLFTEQQDSDYKKALSLLNNKNYSDAESLLLKLSKQVPGHSGPWANLGLLNLVQKKPVEAEKFVKAALKINPKMSQALNLMGLIATHNRDIKAAENYYIQAINSKKGYSNAHYNLALLYDIYLQDIRKAAVQYRFYLQSIDHEDKITLSWVEQLERTLKR